MENVSLDRFAGEFGVLSSPGEDNVAISPAALVNGALSTLRRRLARHGVRGDRTVLRQPRVHKPQSRAPVDTMLAGGAYGALYRTSTEPTRAIDGSRWHYNHQRPLTALGHKPPIARLHERNNPLGTYS